MTDRSKTGAIAAIVLSTLTLGACGGQAKLSCDEDQLYKQAKDNERISVPDGLSPLDPLKEMPLPQASPQKPRPAGSPCLDLPPGQFGADDEDEDEELEEAAQPDPGAEVPPVNKVGEEYEPPTS